MFAIGPSHSVRLTHAVLPYITSPWIVGMFLVLWRQLAFRQKLFGMAKVQALTIDEAKEQRESMVRQKERIMAEISQYDSPLWRWWSRRLLYPTSRFKRIWDGECRCPYPLRS